MDTTKAIPFFPKPSDNCLGFIALIIAIQSLRNWFPFSKIRQLGLFEFEKEVEERGRKDEET